jgi:hypothetical protein
MYIDEHKTGTSVVLQVTVKGETKEYNTTIRYGASLHDKHMIMVEPIRAESGKYLDISGCYVEAELMDEELMRPFKYKVSATKYVTYNKEWYLMIMAHDNAEPLNRREAYRVYLCENAVIQINGHTSVIDGYTHDVSVTGLGLTIKKDKLEERSIKVGDSLSVSFTSTRYDVFYRVLAKVCRVVDSDDDTILVGCRFNKYVEPIADLVYRLSVLEKRIKDRTA